ncbi:type 1 glutamine amidotransferase domain-containing protein [Arenicella xantha]|uniref:Putative intracellular protease/amidase n=1 Tax=Arenicella xantha TaxID=644221 RepID=A0A395JPP6_9GAMM|nr:type 1 glutamine amidotransferase domain-containing protein [Arenicella xantha]RBP53579.1 putative intracellular protease/amidase [Arenicella xantha]
MKKILIFMTNHATLGETDEANGTYAAELTHAVAEFDKAKFQYDLVTIAGGEAPLYGENDFDDDAHKSVLADPAFVAKIKATKKAGDINIDDYDAVFYPGGFGLLSDLATNDEVAALTAQLYDKGAIVGAVCHGPAGLLPVVLNSGEKLLSTKEVTGFTRDEEVAAETIDKIPLVLEDELRTSAKSFSKVDVWQEHLVIDGQLITGQNPASAHAVGKAMVAALV